MKAGIYIRVSTTQQIDRDSLKTQEERLRPYCKIQGYKIHKVYREEGVSAKNLKRPAFEKLTEDIEKKKIQAIFITRLDRITRSLKDLINLMEFLDAHEVKLISLTESIDTTGATGRFVLNLLGIVAQLEREVDSERVSADMHHRALNGKWNGGIIPYGYTTQGRCSKVLIEKGMNSEKALIKVANDYPEKSKLYIDKVEAEIIKKIYNRYLEVKSLRKLTHELNKEGHRSRNGKTWATVSIRRILTNPTYTGKIWYGKRKTDALTGKLKNVAPELWKISDGEHKAIIDDDLYNRVKNLLKQKYMKPSRAKDFYLLTGLLKCGKCKGSMFGYVLYKKKYEKKYNYYRCRNSVTKGDSVCEGMVVPLQVLEKAVVETILNLSKNEKFLNDKELLLKSLRKEAEPSKPSIKHEKEKLLNQEKKLLDRRDVLIEKLESRVIDDEIFIERTDKIKGELETIRDRIAELATKSENIDLQEMALQASYDELCNLKKMWQYLADEEKRDKLRTIVNKIIVNYDRRANKLNLKMQLFLDFADTKTKKPSKFHSVVIPGRRGTHSSNR